MIAFGSQFTPIPYTRDWAGFKAARARKNGVHQYHDDGKQYVVWFYDGPEVHFAELWKGEVPSGVSTMPDGSDGYTQVQNDIDKADFEAGLMLTANDPVTLRTQDGRPVVRLSAASKAHNFNLVVFSIVPGDDTSARFFNSALEPLAYLTVTCYDADGDVTSDLAAAVKTTVDYEPPFNYEALGGWIDIPPSIIGTTDGLYYVGAVGVPDIPAMYGGSIPFVSPTDMALVYSNRVVSDGRASQYLTYNTTYHTNKMRWIFWHPTGSHARVQIYLETFGE